jgi:hypothetical protein
MKLSFVLPLLLIGAAMAQQPGPAPVSDHELIQQLLRRVNELEAEVHRLKQPAAVETGAVRQPEMARAVLPGSAAAAVQTSKPEESAPPQAAQPEPPRKSALVPVEESGMNEMQLPGGLPGIKFQGFSDIQYRATDQKLDHDTFLLGQFNLFMTSRLSDKFNVLAEMVVEANQSNEMGIDLERLLFQYSANDFFHLALGRYHTALGYYNTAYHHSTWLQTTVDRPFLFAFEDQGGILPIHNVGLSASGRIPSGRLGLHYVAEIGNGRAWDSSTAEPVQNVHEEKNRKAFNFALFARPGERGLQTGFSFYHDKAYPIAGPAVSETIYSVHAIYQPSGFEFMNEAMLLRHNVQGVGLMQIPAFYSQISKRFGKVRPYFRYEYMNVPSQDPLVGGVGLRHGPLGGIRYDFTDFAAMKLEYDRIMRHSLPSVDALRTQVTFTF